MIYAVGRSDAAFRMLNTANSQLAMMNSIGRNTDLRALHAMDTRNALQMQKDKLNYTLMDKLDKLDTKIRKDKINRMYK